MPSALNWLATAEECFADESGSLRQGLLTSIFSSVIGMKRIFHLDEMEDDGLAWVGRRTGRRLRAGGHIRVVVTAVNPIEGLIDLELAEDV